MTFYLNPSLWLVSEKMASKLGKGFLRDKIASTAGKIAARNISDEKIAETISDKLSETMPAKLMEVGMVAEVQKVYSAGSFFVVKV